MRNSVVHRSKNMSWDSESDESCHSDSDDSSFVPSKASSGNGEDRIVRNTRNGRTGEARGQGRVRNGLIGRKRPRSVESLFSDLISDSEDTRPDPHRHTDSEETVQAASAAPRRRGRPRTRREREDSNYDDEGMHVARVWKIVGVCEPGYVQKLRSYGMCWMLQSAAIFG